MKKKAIAYIDGFNLYYCSLKKSNYKWLDLCKLCENLLPPEYELIKVKYFTAKVKPHVSDPQKLLRQMSYLNALSQNPKMEIIYGQFSVHKTKMPLASEWTNGNIKQVEVMKTEEKGTDVNLAVQMVADAKDNLFDYALLFSNDSDMAYAVKIATNDCNKKIGLYIDRNSRSYSSLKENIHYTKKLTPNIFKNNQLPNEIILSSGETIKKPIVW